MFEGSHEDMFNSLNKLKNFLKKRKFIVDTSIRSQLDFCIKYDPGNKSLTERAKIRKKVKKNYLLSNTIDEELKKIFLRCNDLSQTSFKLKTRLNEVFSKLRDLKDSF